MNFFLARPEVFQEDRVSIGIFAQRIVQQVDVEVACERVSDDQRRRCQEVHLHERVNAAFEVTVARKYTRCNDIAFLNSGFDLRFQRPGIANAGRAAVTNGVETQRIEVIDEVRFREVVGDDFGPGCQARLHPWFGLQAFFASVTRQQPGCNHYGRVGRICATGDGCNHDSAVANLDIFAVKFCDGRPARLTTGDRGLEMLLIGRVRDA